MSRADIKIILRRPSTDMGERKHYQESKARNLLFQEAYL